MNISDKTLKTILRIRPAISNIENDDLISVDSPTSVLVKPEGKNRVDKYSFTKGKHTQRIFIGLKSKWKGSIGTFS